MPDFLPDTQQTREELAEYYQSVSRIDQGFGKLMAYLEASGKRQNTIVIYISDNGMAFPGAKTTLYEPGMRLPCIISDPTVGHKGTTCDALITWADMTPTLLDRAGIKDAGTDFHGRSFKSILGQEHPKGWDEVYASHTFHEITMYYPMRVLRERRYKLIWNTAWALEYPFASDLWASSTWQRSYRDKSPRFGQRTMEAFLHRPEFELYDLETDPGETVNLATVPEQQARLQQMKDKLKAWQLETKDPWLIMWNHDSSIQGTGVNL